MRLGWFVVLYTGLVVHPAVAEDVEKRTLLIPIGRSALLTTEADMVEVVIANPDIVDLRVHHPKMLSVYGSRLGKTSVRAIGADGQVIKETDMVITYDLPMIRKTLADSFPNETMTVEMWGEQLVLAGQVSHHRIANHALRVVSDLLRSQMTAGALSPQILNLLQIGETKHDTVLLQEAFLPTVTERVFLESMGLAQASKLEGTVGFLVD